MATKLSLIFYYVFVLVVKKHTETHVWICRETGLPVSQDRVEKRVKRAKFQLVTPSKKDFLIDFKDRSDLLSETQCRSLKGTK